MKKTKLQGKQAELTYERKNGYEKISGADLKKTEEICASYMQFLGAGKTEREAHDEAVKMLSAAGFRDMDEIIKSGGAVKTGDKIYRSCSGKTLIALVMGKLPLQSGMHIIGGHTDAPRVDVKQNPLYESGDMALLDTHYYGGIKKYQWVALPLSLHGVFIRANGEKITVSIGENPAEPVFFISDLLPHLAQDQMKKNLAEGVEGENLDVFIGSVPVKDEKAKEKIKRNVLEIMKAKYGLSEYDFLSAELEFVPAGAPREAGLDKSAILGYGQDDRICAYSGLKALLDLNGIPEYTSCVLLCDKEEVGSMGATGMEANFFENTIRELSNLFYGKSDELLVRRAMANSRMISADVNALFDPLYSSAFEKKNAAFLNHGICVTKFTGARGKSGANDANAEFMAEIRRIFDDGGVIWQTAELGKVDLGGGGTIAALMARYGMEVIDAGPGLLSMHAPWEASGKLDIFMTYKGYLAFLKDDRK